MSSDRRNNFYIDEELQAAIDDFLFLYGDDEEEEVDVPDENHSFDASTMEEISSEEAEEGVLVSEWKYEVYEDTNIPYKEKKSIGKIMVAFVCVILGIALLTGGGYLTHKIMVAKKESDKNKEAAVASVKASTESTESTEVIPEEPSKWFAEKEVCHPVLTDRTISLPKADLSVFQLAAEQEQSEEEIAEEDRIDPWKLVTLNLESVPGSINLTSPGVLEETTQLTSTYMVLVDVDTGEIVAERECEKQIVPASMTKILTVITARDYIDETKFGDTYTITSSIIDEALNSGLSAVGFKPGDEATVKDMLYGTIVCSGADAAMGLAEYCEGTQDAFVEKMNENAELIGISDTAHFTNVVGTYNEDLYCTMTDMASILSVAIQDDLLLDVLSTRRYMTDIKYPDLDMPDGIELSNWFLRRIEDKETAGEVIGAKTGFVNQSGFCCASYYKANSGKRYICVTGNANSSWRAIYDHVSVYRSFTE